MLVPSEVREYLFAYNYCPFFGGHIILAQQYVKQAVSTISPILFLIISDKTIFRLYQYFFSSLHVSKLYNQ